MAKFVTIGYGDRAGYERTDPPCGKPLTNKTRGCVWPIQSPPEPR